MSTTSKIQSSGKVFNAGGILGKPHTQDADCTIDLDTLCCKSCGVDHSDECLECGGRGFHKPGCASCACDGERPLQTTWCCMKAANLTQAAVVIDELIFRSYVRQRMKFPNVEPERWAAIFENVPEMEERFLKTFILKLMEAAEEIDDQLKGDSPDQSLGAEQIGKGGDGPAKTSPLNSLQVASRQEQPTKAVNHVAGDGNLALMRPTTNCATSKNNTHNLVRESGASVAPLSFIENEIDSLTKSVIDAEMRARHRRNFSVSSRNDPAHDPRFS